MVFIPRNNQLNNKLHYMCPLKNLLNIMDTKRKLYQHKCIKKKVKKISQNGSEYIIYCHINPYMHDRSIKTEYILIICTYPFIVWFINKLSYNWASEIFFFLPVAYDILSYSWRRILPNGCLEQSYFYRREQ